MPRTGGDKTRNRILEVAEELFSKKGFHATSVNQITRQAKVNKALVYYYFKDKNDIVLSLFRNMIEELSSPRPSRGRSGPGSRKGDPGIREALTEEISFLEKKKNIISVMLMESLKTHDQDTSIFKCAEMVIAHELEGPKTNPVLVHEFFTGFIPLISFVALRDKFCDYFQCDQKEALDYFVQAFTTSHINSHLKQEVDDDNNGG